MGELSSDPYEFMTTPDWGVVPIKVMPRHPLRAERVKVPLSNSVIYEWWVTMPDGTRIQLSDGDFVQAFVQEGKR